MFIPNKAERPLQSVGENGAEQRPCARERGTEFLELVHFRLFSEAFCADKNPNQCECECLLHCMQVALSLTGI